MLGVFSYRCDPASPWISIGEIAPKAIGKKVFAFIAYLLLNHQRSVSADELMERFWPEESSRDPGSALKFTLHKARVLLKAIMPEQENFINTLSDGHYCWDESLKIELDVESFEQLCLKAKKPGFESEQRELYVKALYIYERDLLPACREMWAGSLRSYYHTLYVDAVQCMLRYLMAENNWLEVVNLCEKAGEIDSSIEDCTVCMMRALIALGQVERAADCYETYRAMLWSCYGVTPGEKVEQMYAMVMEARKGNFVNIRDLVRFFHENKKDKAFLCDFSVFRNFVLLEQRCQQRDNHSSILAAVSIRNSGEFKLADIRHLERVLLMGLRSTDPVTRLNAGSFLILLKNADMKAGEKVTKRLDHLFKRIYPGASVSLEWQLFSLEDIAQNHSC